MGVSEVMIWLLLHVYFSISKGNFFIVIQFFFLKSTKFYEFFQNLVQKIWYKIWQFYKNQNLFYKNYY